MRRLLLPSLFLVGCLHLPAAINEQLLALVPPDTKLIVSIDVARAQSSNLGRYLLNRVPESDGNFEVFIRETGFDPRQDLQQILFTGSGSQGQFAVLAQGVFDPQRITALSKTKGAVVRKYHGLNVIVSDSTNRNSAALAFPMADVAIMGDLATVQRILDGSNAPSALDPTLTARISAVGEKNDAWFASLIGGASLAGHFGEEETHGDSQSDPQAKVLAAVTGTSGGIRFGDAIELSANAVTRSPKDATSLADVVRLGISMVEMQRQKDLNQKDSGAAIVAGALDRINLNPVGDQLRISLSLSEKEAEQLVDIPKLSAIPSSERNSRKAPGQSQ